MVYTDIELVRYDDGEFLLSVDGTLVGEVLTNSQARAVRKQLEDGTFQLHHHLSQHAGVV